MANYPIPNEPLKRADGGEYVIPSDPLTTNTIKYPIPRISVPLLITEGIEYFIKPIALERGREAFDPQNKPIEGTTEKELSNGRISKLGTPVACPLVLIIQRTKETFTSPEETPDIMLSVNGPTSTINGIYLDDTLITVTQNKQLVTTNIQGSLNGAVVEYIGMDNYRISINGRFSFSNGRYNQDQVKSLFNNLNLVKPIGVSCWYLSQFGITDIIITDYEFPQAEGQFSTQYFTINAISFNKERIKSIVGSGSTTNI